MAPAARLAAPPPAAGAIPPGHGSLTAPCDATASGSEDAQVRLARGTRELSLCSHHFSLHEFELAVQGWRVTHDNRGGLSLFFDERDNGDDHADGNDECHDHGQDLALR